MSNTVNLNIGLITVGSVIAVPTQKIYNNDVNPILNVKVIVDIPTGLQYDSSVLPSGTYNSGTNTWTIPTILAGGYTEGIFNFLVTDDTSPEYTITFTATKDGSCENCTQNNNICIITNGISCTQLRLCDPLLAMPEEYTFIKNSTNNAINVSTNDQPCPGALTRTYQWLDITNVNGTITGLPNSATYTPDTDYTGTVLARYGLYCNAVLVDVEEVRINVVDIDLDPVDEIPATSSPSVFGTKCDGTRGSVKPIVIKDITTYASQGSNLSITLGDAKILHINPTADINVTINPGASWCSVKDIDIKHIGTGANRNFNIRVLNGAGTNTVDGDTYFEFNNSGTASNNLRGYNFTAYNFYYSGNELFVK